MDILEKHLDKEFQGFQTVGRLLLKECTKKVNGVGEETKPNNITGTDKLIKVCTIYIGQQKEGQSKKQKDN